jgi:hypothetical protein
MTRTALAACEMLPVAAAPVRGEDLLRNAWGIYAAPTTYTVTSAGDYNQGPTGTSLDVGVYYTRFVTRRFSW